MTEGPTANELNLALAPARAEYDAAMKVAVVAFAEAIAPAKAAYDDALVVPTLAYDAAQRAARAAYDRAVARILVGWRPS